MWDKNWVWPYTIDYVERREKGSANTKRLLPSVYYFTKLYMFAVGTSQRYPTYCMQHVANLAHLSHTKLLQKHTVRKIHISVTRRELGKYAKFASCKQQISEENSKCVM